MEVSKFAVAVSLVSMISFGSTNVSAMDKNGLYFAFGVGSRSCEDYVSFKEKRLEPFTPEQYEIAARVVQHWLLGYLTAHNLYVRDTYNVMGDATIEQLEGWIETYCKSNQKKSFAEAVFAMVESLHPKRVVVGPSVSK
jgi:hypothetical protein